MRKRQNGISVMLFILIRHVLSRWSAWSFSSQKRHLFC